jgi:hypothetical protein
MARTTGPRLAKKLHEAGLIPGDLNDIHRIVLDIRHDRVPVLYVEYFSDTDKWIEVLGASRGEIKIVTNSCPEHPGETGDH